MDDFNFDSFFDDPWGDLTFQDTPDYTTAPTQQFDTTSSNVPWSFTGDPEALDQSQYFNAIPDAPNMEPGFFGSPAHQLLSLMSRFNPVAGAVNSLYSAYNSPNPGKSLLGSALGQFGVPGLFGKAALNAYGAENPEQNFMQTLTRGGASLLGGRVAGPLGSLAADSMFTGKGGGTSGGVDFSRLAEIAAGLYGVNRAETAMQEARDPNAQYRAQYAQQLKDLMSNPGSITSLPGYKAGLEAITRGGAAQGLQGSGAMAARLADFGQNFYDQQLTRLSQLAGTNMSPSVYFQQQNTAADDKASAYGLLASSMFKRKQG